MEMQQLSVPGGRGLALEFSADLDAAPRNRSLLVKLDRGGFATARRIGKERPVFHLDYPDSTIPLKMARYEADVVAGVIAWALLPYAR